MAEFNPAEHNVEEVNAYLETADANERSRVLDLEDAGPKRKSVKRDWPEAEVEDDPVADDAQLDEPARKGGFLNTGALVGIPEYSGPTHG